ncbi:hypothetical protein EYF80_040106 [Liparis tanakae]|uniref:Uncharacterized protein n=1 Tax=Liparis tanakae TaxID=230148 RepID=A0A4Z2G8T4_9TELE|nr:hypothetical protein EYF80_040106 [Liparis tanakae]
MEDLSLSPRQQRGMLSPRGFSVEENFPPCPLELKSRFKSFPVRNSGTLHSNSELEPLKRLNQSHKVLARQSQIHWFPFKRRYWRDTRASMVSPVNTIEIGEVGKIEKGVIVQGENVIVLQVLQAVKGSGLNVADVVGVEPENGAAGVRAQGALGLMGGRQRVGFRGNW